MSLRDRLEKLQAQRGLQPAAPVAPPQPGVAERLARLTRTHARPTEREVAQALGGEVVSDGLILIERVFPLTFVHGNATLEEVLQAPLHLLD
ncbi:MAG: hypothetical protein WHV61_11520, partial [Burkholderiales bacterium]